MHREKAVLWLAVMHLPASALKGFRGPAVLQEEGIGDQSQWLDIHMGLAGSQQMGNALVNSGIFADPMLHDGAAVNFQVIAPFLQFQVYTSTGNEIDLPLFLTFLTPVGNDLNRDVDGRPSGRDLGQ